MVRHQLYVGKTPAEKQNIVDDVYKAYPMYKQMREFLKEQADGHN